MMNAHNSCTQQNECLNELEEKNRSCLFRITLQFLSSSNKVSLERYIIILTASYFTDWSNTYLIGLNLIQLAVFTDLNCLGEI